MAERLVPINLFTNALVSGLASGSRVSSSILNLTQDVVSMRSVVYVVSSTLSTADVGFFYAISRDGTQFGSYTDVSALQLSTFSTANSTGVFQMEGPPLLSPYLRFVVSGTGSNPLDTRVNATLWLRMT